MNRSVSLFSIVTGNLLVVMLSMFAVAVTSCCSSAQAMEVFAFQRLEALGVNEDTQVNQSDFTGPVEINTIGIPVKLPPNVMFMKGVQPDTRGLQQHQLRSNPALEDDFRSLPNQTQPSTVYPAPPRF